MTAPEAVLITQQAAAERLGCSVEKIRQLVREDPAFRAAKVSVRWVRGYRIRVDLFDKAVAEAIGIEKAEAN